MRKILILSAIPFAIGVAQANPVDNLKKFLIDMVQQSGYGETIAIPGPYEFVLDGVVTPAWGNATCPSMSDEKVWWVGGRPNSYPQTCMVFEKDTKQVRAFFRVGANVVNELWKVDRTEAGRMTLRRPNGDYVYEGNNVRANSVR